MRKLQRLYTQSPGHYPLLALPYGPICILNDANLNPQESKRFALVFAQTQLRARGQSLIKIVENRDVPNKDKHRALKAAGKTLAHANLAGAHFVDFSLTNVFVKLEGHNLHPTTSWIDLSTLGKGNPRDPEHYLISIVRNTRDLLFYCSQANNFPANLVEEKASDFMVMFGEYMEVYGKIYPEAPQMIQSSLGHLFDGRKQLMQNHQLEPTTKSFFILERLWGNDIMNSVRTEITKTYLPYSSQLLHTARATVMQHSIWEKLQVFP